MLQNIRVTQSCNLHNFKLITEIIYKHNKCSLMGEKLKANEQCLIILNINLQRKGSLCTTNDMYHFLDKVRRNGKMRDLNITALQCLLEIDELILFLKLLTKIK